MTISKSVLGKTKKLIIRGFVKEGEDPTNIPKRCPRCGGKLHKTDCLATEGFIFVYCLNYLEKLRMCRWCEIYEL